MTDTNTSICTWQVEPPRLRSTFGRQAIPMSWDFTEANVFGDAAGDYQRCVGSLGEVLERIQIGVPGSVIEHDATESFGDVEAVVSTDPPYYDNVGYADLSDFFYIWLRRSLSEFYAELFSTVLTPKTSELIASPARFGGSSERARAFFESGLGTAFARMRDTTTSAYPVTVFYAFKQAERDVSDDESRGVVLSQASTGWETMLEGLLGSGFSVSGTWPIRTELATR